MKRVLLAILLFSPSQPLSAQLEQTARFPHVPSGGGYGAEIVVTSIMPPGTPPAQLTITVKNQQGEIQAAPSSTLVSGERYSFVLPNNSGSPTVNTVSVFSSGRFTSYGTIATSTFDLVINPEIERSSFKIPVDTGTQAGVEVDTGVALANFGAGPAKVNAYLKDPAFKDTNGFPLTTGTASFDLGGGQQIAKFSSEMFPILKGTTFHGEIWFTASDPTLQNATSLVVPLGLRTKNVPGFVFSFSPVTVTSLPYASVGEITNQQFRLVYFCEKDQCAKKVAKYQNLFPLAVQLGQFVVGIENDRSGYGYSTLEFLPSVLEVTGTKNFAEYPTDGRERLPVVVSEVEQQLGPGPKIIIAGNNFFASEGFAGSVITLPDKLLTDVESVVSLLNSGRTTLDTGEVLFAMADVFGLAHEIGHNYGAVHTTDVDDSPYGTGLREIMIASFSGATGLMRTLFPGVRLTNNAQKDTRWPTFGSAILKQMSTLKLEQCTTRNFWCGLLELELR